MTCGFYKGNEAVTWVEAWKVYADGNPGIWSLKTSSVAQDRLAFLLASSGRHGRLWDPAQWHAEPCLQLSLCRCASKRFQYQYFITVNMNQHLLELARHLLWSADT